MQEELPVVWQGQKLWHFFIQFDHSMAAEFSGLTFSISFYSLDAMEAPLVMQTFFLFWLASSSHKIESTLQKLYWNILDTTSKETINGAQQENQGATRPGCALTTELPLPWSFSVQSSSRPQFCFSFFP
jgi:hypothetical protein